LARTKADWNTESGLCIWVPQVMVQATYLELVSRLEDIKRHCVARKGARSQGDKKDQRQHRAI
jgi:hypothetical protein